MPKAYLSSKSLTTELFHYMTMILGAFLAALAIEVFFIPNRLIDGGVVGLSMICGKLLGQRLIPLFLILFNIPFLILAYRYIGRVFLIHMSVAVFFFSLFLILIGHYTDLAFEGDTIEVIVLAGMILGVGLGLIIRAGASLDGTEILGLIMNQKTGFTVGQVVFCCNVFVFGTAGFVFQDWHPPILSLITYMVVIKVMDAVIVGLDETKSVIIISAHSEAISEAIIHELGLGLTVMYGRGGFSGAEKEILYVIAERLQLAELKEIILQEDPNAFIAIENLHEVANGKKGVPPKPAKQRINRILTNIFSKKP